MLNDNIYFIQLELRMFCEQFESAKYFNLMLHTHMSTYGALNYTVQGNVKSYTAISLSWLINYLFIYYRQKRNFISNIILIYSLK